MTQILLAMLKLNLQSSYLLKHILRGSFTYLPLYIEERMETGCVKEKITRPKNRKHPNTTNWVLNAARKSRTRRRDSPGL